MNHPIVVVDYDPQWPTRFETIRRTLAASLVDVPLVAIEHVGSTSVPGLAAKPIIDVDVIVQREHVDAAVSALTTIGYALLGDLGVPDRHAFTRPDTSDLKQNVYVTVDGCLSLRNHLALRDVLRADPALRDEYAVVKRQLAASTDDIDEYVDGKTTVIRKILERAGITPAELDEVEGVNRR